MPESTTNPKVIKHKQVRNLLAIIVVFGLVLLAVYSLFANHSPPPAPKEKEETIHFETPLAHVDAQSMWVERAQNQIAEEAKKTQALNQQLQLLQQSKETQDKTAQEQTQTLQSLQSQVETLQKQLAQQKSATHSPSGGDFNADEGVIHDAAIQLSPPKVSQPPLPAKNPLTFVPAGTFVRAIALGGADASAGVTSQANPTPMLFRLLDQGTLPNHQTSQLKNCIATAAAIGDVSSERGQIRLERISCTRTNGEVIEIPVEATVFGPDGKNGIRGNPLWREGALLQRAFAAGTLSGLSNGIAHGYTSSSFNAFGSAQTVVDNGKILQYGLANGLSNAAEKLAEYNVKRAEQYHPVIQLSAGTIVDIVFLKGFYLDGRKTEDGQDYLSNTENNSPPKPTSVEDATDQTKENLAPLPLTPQQIQSLKQKNEQLGYL